MRKLFLFFFSALFLLLPVPVSAAILVLPEPGADPHLVRNVQAVTDAFDQILATELGASLTNDVRIFVSPNRNSYIVVLQRELGLSREVAERSGKMTSGFSASRRQSIALNGELPMMKTLGGVASVVAHELFHQVQGELEGAKWVRLYWVSEGTADYVGAMVADRLGVLNLDGWKQQRVNLLRKTPGHALPQDLADIRLAQWTALMEQNKAPYTMSDMMVLFLLEQGSNKKPAAISEYFRACHRLQDGKKALQSAFGIDAANFSVQFTPWFSKLMAQKGAIEFAVEGPVNPSLLQESEKLLPVLLAQWQDKWRLPLQSDLRVVLTASTEDYAAALKRELGYSPETTAKMTKETWRYNRNTAVIRMDAALSPELRARRLYDVISRMWLADTVAPALTDTLFWLKIGGILCGSSLAVDASYPGAYARQQEVWLRRLDGELPVLLNMASAVDYQSSLHRLGAAKTEAISALATLALFQKHGADSYGRWLDQTKKSGDARAAFALIYGRSWEEFAADFHAWLESKRKKAA